MKRSLNNSILKAWHVTTAIHNSRYSQRMFDNYVKMNMALLLSEKDEFVITDSIVKIVKDDNLKVLEYNICRDHMHILLICEKEELAAIAGKLKAVSARKCNIERGTTRGQVPADTTRGQVPLSLSEKKKKYTPLWTQKFGRREINDENDLKNVIEYIKNNRKKHGLLTNKKTRSLAEQMFCSYEEVTGLYR